jgi:tRNA-2-methylthio-N6-dimethylallyladenosine synthase
MGAVTVHIKSFGCQMNKLDTALVTAAMKEAGFVLTEKVREADAVLINTCSVREHAEQRVFSHLGHLKHVKEEKPEMVVGVIGCMAQRLGSGLLADGVVDVVCGPAQIPQITKLVKDALGERKKMVAVTEKIRRESAQSTALEEFESVYDRADKAIAGQAYVRVMRGCNKFCSYCVVPYVRGPEVSRAPGAVAEQIQRLAGQGVKVVTLLGQAVNCYEYKAGEKTYCLADLLEKASEVEGIEWIRFVTSYPQVRFYDEILGAMAGLKKVCNYLHMPAQSGSDKILAAMNRKYTAAEYLAMIAKAAQVVAGIEVAGDFIVGFPGETDEDFAATVEVVRRARYKNCFVFKYSQRPGTTAEKRLQDVVAQEVKRERNIRLLAEQEKISGELAERFLGKKVRVLVEGPSKKAEASTCKQEGYKQLVGRTAEDWIVVFDGPEGMAGEFAEVEIERTSPLTLYGTVS